MRRYIKKAYSFLLAVVFVCSFCINAGAAEQANLDSVINDTAAYLYRTVDAPQVGAVGGEWAVFGLARSGADIPQSYYENYYKTVERYVKERNGVLSDKKYTEYSRMILALTAIGKAPSDVAGYSLVTPLGDYEKTIWQGINGPAWALIALDSGGYDMPQNSGATIQASREMYVKYLLDCQVDGGGWSLYENDPAVDPDITAMTLTALARYQDRDDVKDAVSKALDRLSAMQNEQGGFSSRGSESFESTVQVMVALCELGISLDDSRFVKNGHTLLNCVMDFYRNGGGFSHTRGDENPNQMATEQALYGIVAARRAARGESSLYNISDPIVIAEPMNRGSFGLPDKNADIGYMDIKYQNKTFDDIVAHKNRQAIEALASREIINGKTKQSFEPDATMTRAEFAAIVVRGLGLPMKSENCFADVSQDDWFAGYVGTAHFYGIVNGMSENTFQPNGTLTREEAGTMISRAASLCGMNTQLDLFTARAALAGFTDYMHASEWAFCPLAFCYENGILDESDMQIRPKELATRAEVAQMLFNMMGKAELL